LIKFQDEYREACKELPTPSLKAEKVQDELHHHRIQQRRRRYLITRGCTAAVVFLICGVGTVAAKNYRDSIIEVNESGFTITRLQNAPDQTKNRIGQRDGVETGSFFKMGGVFSIEEDTPEEGALVAMDKEAVSLQNQMAVYGRDTGKMDSQCLKEDDCREYGSIEAFREMENLVAAIPDKALFGETFTWEHVLVVDRGRQILTTFSNEDTYFSLNQWDNRECESYSSSTSYGGKCADKRSFTNSQGLSYVVFDTVDEEGQVISVHAVISLNGWDLSATFEGFEKDVVEKVLKEFDLSVYY